MTDDDTTNNSNGHQIAQLIAAIRSLEDRFTAVEISVTEVKTRLASVEEVIVARLSNTRPLDQEVLARLNELAAGQAAMHEELAAMRADYERFREETNRNFKLVNQKLEHLNNDFLNIRAEHTLLEKRVSRLEEAA